MIANTTVVEIRRLVDSGRFSQRKIAQLCGISRGTVQAIASGKRGIHPRRSGGGEQYSTVSVKIGRCPVCGGMVELPCRACHVRRLVRLA